MSGVFRNIGRPPPHRPASVYPPPLVRKEKGVLRNLFRFETTETGTETIVSALSETKRLFRLFRFYTETASFGVSIESKQQEKKPETNRNESNMKNI
jgi:hypothetical protein